MIKKLKKAFTITELVIVIAVIAILAAVLIPTFTTLIDRANRSSDESAVYNMNLILSTADTEKPDSVSEALKLLEEAGMDAKEYKALVKGNAFYYNLEKNRVIYLEVATNTILYPQEYVNMSETEINEMFANGQWYNLEGRMAGDETWQTATVYESTAALKAADVTDGVVKSESGETITAAKVSSAAKLISVVDYIEADENNGAGFTLMLGDDIDLKDSEWKPIEEFAGDFDGCGYAIQGLRMTDLTADTKDYMAAGVQTPYMYYGFVSVFSGNYFGNVVFENIVIDNPGLNKEISESFKRSNHTIGVAMGAILVRGGVSAEAHNVTIENVVIDQSCQINAPSRVGGIVGFIGGEADSANATGAFPKDSVILIQNCRNDADITSEIISKGSHATVGGIVATSNQRADDVQLNIVNCVNTGNLRGYITAGIMADSWASNTEWKNSSAEDYKNGGVIHIFGCINSGNIVSEYSNKTDVYAAGIYGKSNYTSDDGIGDARVYSIIVEQCINVGTVTCENGTMSDIAIEKTEVYTVHQDRLEQDETKYYTLIVKGCKTGDSTSTDDTLTAVADLHSEYYEIALMKTESLTPLTLASLAA